MSESLCKTCLHKNKCDPCDTDLFKITDCNKYEQQVGDDWWLERHEYDGSEWWEYKQLPVKPTKVKTINRVHDAPWEGLEGIWEDQDK